MYLQNGICFQVFLDLLHSFIEISFYNVMFFLFYNFKMHQNIILFALLCEVMHANILFHRQTNNPNFGQGFAYVDIQCQSGILATLSTDLSTNLIMNCKNPNFEQKQKILPLSSTETFKIRLPSQNCSSDLNESLILFSQTRLTNFFSFSNSNEEILNYFINNNSYYIVDLCYGNNRKQIIAIGFFYNTSTYGLIFFNASITPTFMRLLNISSSISFLDKIQYRNSRIYARFNDQLAIYLMDENFTDVACFSYPPFYQRQYSHFQLECETIMQAYGKSVVVRNSTDYKILANYSHDSLISGACVVGTYIIFVDDDQIIQYDYEISSIISRTMLPSLDIFTLRYFFQNTFIIFYQPTQMSSSSIFFYNFTSSYNSNSSNCLPTYIYSSIEFLCVKGISSNSSFNNSNDLGISNVTSEANNVTNSNISMINSSISNNSNSNTTITTNPLQNSSPSSNSSLNTTTSSDPVQNTTIITNLNQTQMNNTFYLSSDNDQQQQYNIDILISQYFVYLNKQYGLSLTYGASYLLILSSFKISPEFLYSLIIIFNDLWFYQFHNKTYPHSVRIIFQNVDIIETKRINVQFLKLIQMLNTTSSFGLQNNNQMQKYISVKSIQQSNVFFTRSLVQDYRNSFILSLSLYVLLKILKIMIIPIKRKARCIFQFFNFIRMNSKLWLSISSIIENILPNLGFDIGVQILLPSFSSTLDKFNFCSCLFVFFIVILYSFSFYPMAFCFSIKKSRTQLMRSCRNHRNSFFFQPALFVFRVLLRSFIHSYFIHNYMQQIFFLIIVDCFSIFTSIYIRKYYKSILIFTLYTSYLILLTIFDVYFYLQTLCKFPKYLRRELFGVAILGGLFIISALACLTFFIKYILNLLKNCKKLTRSNKLIKASAQTQKTSPKLSMSKTAKNVSSSTNDRSQQCSPKKLEKTSKMVIICKIGIKSVHKKEPPQMRLSNKTLKSLKDKQSLMKNIMRVNLSDHIKECMDPDFAELPEIILKKTGSD